MTKQKTVKSAKKQTTTKKQSLVSAGRGKLKQWQKLTAGGVFSFALFGSLLSFFPQSTPATTVAGPAPSDAVTTQFGSIGKWMLQSNGQVSNWGGTKYQNKTLDEVINVILVDPTSTSASASTTKLNSVMSQAGFPSQIGHSNGFQGLINGTVYSQQPTGLNAFSDNPATSQNDHGRMFGPSAAASGGYVWTGALSTETPTYFFGILTGHAYVSFNAARDALARGLVGSGQTQVASVDLANTYNNASTTTGDHDGKAVVIVLK